MNEKIVEKIEKSLNELSTNQQETTESVDKIQEYLIAKDKKEAEEKEKEEQEALTKAETEAQTQEQEQEETESF